MYPVPIFCRICGKLVQNQQDLAELLTLNAESKIIIYLHKGCKASASQELLSQICRDVEYDLLLSDDNLNFHEC